MRRDKRAYSMMCNTWLHKAVVENDTSSNGQRRWDGIVGTRRTLDLICLADFTGKTVNLQFQAQKTTLRLPVDKSAAVSLPSGRVRATLKRTRAGDVLQAARNKSESKLTTQHTKLIPHSALRAHQTTDSCLSVIHDMILGLRRKEMFNAREK